MNLPSSKRVCVFRRKQDNLSASSTGTWCRGMSAIASMALMVSAAHNQRLLYFIPPYSK